MSKELTKYHKQIENRIFTVRKAQVMLDYHLAELYEVETKRINEQVKRNIKRFPQNFIFQLTETEWSDLQLQMASAEGNNNLKSHIATSSWGGKRKLPHVFTEQGVVHLGASPNYLGKKWIVFSKMDKIFDLELL